MLPYCLLSTEAFHKLTAVADSQKTATLSKSFFFENVVSSLHSSPYGRREEGKEKKNWTALWNTTPSPWKNKKKKEKKKELWGKWITKTVWKEWLSVKLNQWWAHFFFSLVGWRIKPRENTSGAALLIYDHLSLSDMIREVLDSFQLSTTKGQIIPI